MSLPISIAPAARASSLSQILQASSACLDFRRRPRLTFDRLVELHGMSRRVRADPCSILQRSRRPRAEVSQTAAQDAQALRGRRASVGNMRARANRCCDWHRSLDSSEASGPCATVRSRWRRRSPCSVSGLAPASLLCRWMGDNSTPSQSREPMPLQAHYALRNFHCETSIAN